MTLSKEQLVMIRDAVECVGCVGSSDSVRLAKSASDAINAEIDSILSRGTTLSEAVASGGRYRRKAWPKKWPFAAKICKAYDGLAYLDKNGIYIDNVSEDDIVAGDWVLSRVDGEK